MIKIMMHGCCGHMGQVISELVEKDPEAEIVAGVDIAEKAILLIRCIQIFLSVRKMWTL